MNAVMLRWGKDLTGTHLSRWTDLDFLWGHEEDGAQGAGVHLCHRDGEEQDPGEEAGQAVGEPQERVPQEQPYVGADKTLYRYTV